MTTPRVSRHVVHPETESEEEDEVEHQTRSDRDSGRFVVIPESDATEPPRTPLTDFSRESSTAVEEAVSEHATGVSAVIALSSPYLTKSLRSFGPF